MVVQIPVRYRAKGSETSHEGAVKDLSLSGVLLAGALRLPKSTLVEMVFEMPGQQFTQICCQLGTNSPARFCTR